MEEDLEPRLSEKLLIVGVLLYIAVVLFYFGCQIIRFFM